MGRHQLQEHLAEVLPTVQVALTDPDPAVREAAGAAFGILFKVCACGGVFCFVLFCLFGVCVCGGGG